MQKIKDMLTKLITSPWFYVAILGFILGVFLWNYFHKPPDVVTESQTVVETPKGVEITANKAGFKLDKGQTKEVSQIIREIRTERVEPQYVIHSSGATVKADTEQARKDNKADFAIVTDPNNPDEKVDLDSIDKDTKVELNQYNINAYKKVIRTIDYSTNKQATFTISRRITNDGQYLGIGAGYDWDNNRVIAKVSYSW